MKRFYMDDKEIKYKIYNPGGNITALVLDDKYTKEERKIINDYILKINSKVEQVGFLSNSINRLEMAGGEFCLNATRCAIYEYSKRQKGDIELTVSGSNNLFKGRKLANNIVELEMDINKDINRLVELNDNLTYINIDGILIVIINEKESKEYISLLKKDEEKAKEEIKKLMINKIETKEKAIGVMLLEKINNNLKINPIVWVKDIDTMFYETACGSGSLGTAIYNCYKNNNKEISIIQPSNYKIDINLIVKENRILRAIVKGVVLE